MVSIKQFEKALVLLCVCSQPLKKRGFYCMCVLETGEKALVLLCVRSKMVKNNWFYKQRYLKTKKTIGKTIKSMIWGGSGGCLGRIWGKSRDLGRIWGGSGEDLGIYREDLGRIWGRSSPPPPPPPPPRAIEIPHLFGSVDAC